ncbi:MAG: hypothetical protein WCH61_11205, partial [bacterium]
GGPAPLLAEPTFNTDRAARELAQLQTGYGSANLPAALDLGLGLLGKMHEAQRELVGHAGQPLPQRAAGGGAEHELPAPNARQGELLARAAAALEDAATGLAAEQWEIAAVPLSEAANYLGQILGLTHSPDLLDTIFSRFCIGK